MGEYAPRDAPPVMTGDGSYGDPMKEKKKKKKKGNKMHKHGGGFAEGILLARSMGSGCYGAGLGGACGPYGGLGLGVPPVGLFGIAGRGGLLGGCGDGYGYDGGYRGHHDGHCGPDGFRWLDTQGQLRSIEKDVDDTDRDVLKSATETCKEIGCAISNLKDLIYANDGRINDKICCEAQRIEKSISDLQHSQDLGFCGTNKTISDTGFVLSKEICNLSRQLQECCCKLDIDIREVNHSISDTAKDTRYMMNDGFKDMHIGMDRMQGHIFGRIEALERCNTEQHHKITCNQKEIAHAICELPRIIRDNAAATNLIDALTGVADPATIAKISATITGLQRSDFTCQPCIAC